MTVTLIPKQEPPQDPNAPLEAFQRQLDNDYAFMHGRGDSFRQPLDLPTGGGEGVNRLGHLPGLDEQEGGGDE